jgi:hypothetical protein
MKSVMLDCEQEQNGHAASLHPKEQRIGAVSGEV